MKCKHWIGCFSLSMYIFSRVDEVQKSELYIARTIAVDVYNCHCTVKEVEAKSVV